MSTLPPNTTDILLVDDNEHGLVARGQVLGSLGYRITKARDAEEAIELFKAATAPFHLMVTDFRMKKMDGVELIAAVRGLSPGTRIILLSGFVEPLGLTEQSTGADAVISKSGGEVGQLTRAVKRLLTSRPHRKPAASAGSVRVTMVKSV